MAGAVRRAEGVSGEEREGKYQVEGDQKDLYGWINKRRKAYRKKKEDEGRRRATSVCRLHRTPGPTARVGLEERSRGQVAVEGGKYPAHRRGFTAPVRILLRRNGPARV
jgi:hypothetical protein